jgi:hypothetical protein
MKNQSVPGCGLGRVRCRIDKQTNLQRAGWFESTASINASHREAFCACYAIVIIIALHVICDRAISDDERYRRQVNDAKLSAQ